MSKRGYSFGIISVFTAAFCGLVLISTGTLLFITLKNAFETTRTALSVRIETLIDDATDGVDGYFDALEAKANWLTRQIDSGELSVRNRTQLREVLWGGVASLPQILEVAIQFPDGRGMSFESKTGILHSVEWDPVFRGQSANIPTDDSLDRERGFWSVRPSVLDGIRHGNFLKPFNTPEGQTGVIMVVVDLNPLSKILASDAFVGQYRIVRFLLLNDRLVLAHPELQKFSSVDRPTIDQLEDPFLSKLRDVERSQLNLIADIPGTEVFGIENGVGDRLDRLFAIRDITRPQSGGKLTLGVHVDPRAGEAEVTRLIGFTVFGIGLLLVSFLIAFLLGRRAAIPMQRFASAAHLVEQDRLDEVGRLPVGRVKELASAASAFNSMVDGLRERARVRDLFGKYVPQNVATLLVQDDSISKPKNTDATILFLDIVGFSSISEKLSPAEVVETMNLFFSEAVAIIEAEQGMVTQFQGDAILAVFNVPVEIADHAEAAIRTSIAIQQAINSKTYSGHQLRCRIGINTGPLVAGAIGAADRLSYTVYGDAVNVAARLEQLNKNYDTRILISSTTTGLAKGFSFERIDEVQVKGRELPVEVFTLSEQSAANET